ncbi:hypothetical protein DMA15_19310 [Streptomyces sp. WAC 01529]|nr:hypothetical protein DMA15_19310 [Streptomyces sp. WAC 01529]
MSISNLFERAEPGTVDPLPDTVTVEQHLAALLIEAPQAVHPAAGAIAEALERQMRLHASAGPSERETNRRIFYDAVHEFIEASRLSLHDPAD